MSGFSRRHMLRSAGVALALPWLESLAPRTARAQAAGAARKRYVSMFYPHGAVPYYWPTAPGVGEAIREGDGGSVLDNTVITLASSMHSSNHDTGDMPIILLGSGGGVLKQNIYQRWAAGTSPELADLHLMLMQKVYGCPDTTFGKCMGTYQTGLSQPTEILA